MTNGETGKRRKLISAAVLVVAAVILTFKFLPIGKTGDAAVELLDKAIKGKRPILLFFYAKICTACLDMEKVIDAIRPQFENEIAFIKVDYNDNRNAELIKRFAVLTIPTTFILDNRGRKVQTYVGVKKQQELIETLRELLKGKRR